MSTALSLAEFDSIYEEEPQDSWALEKNDPNWSESWSDKKAKMNNRHDNHNQDDEKSRKKKTYPLISVNDLLQRSPVQWLVRDLIQTNSMGFLYGDPACGKTFLGLNLAFSLCHGEDWLGNKVKASRNVIYIAGEGVNGLRNRIEALCLERDAPTNFNLIEATINFFEFDKNEINNFVESIAHAKPGFIIIDTLARTSTGAEENSSKDMGKYVETVDLIKNKLNCSILIMHHTTKGFGASMRGSTALKGAADFILCASVLDGERKIRIEKQKDGPQGAEIGYKLEQVILGSDDEGDEITSCVVKPEKVSARAEKKSFAKGDKQKLLVSIAAGLCKELPEYPDCAPQGRPSAKMSDINSRWVNANTGMKSSAPTYFNRTLKSLIEKNVLCCDDGKNFIWFP